MKLKDNNKGITLVEIIVSLAISTIVVLAVYSFIFAGTNSYKSTNKQTTVQQETSYVMKMLGGKIKAGNSSDARIINSSGNIVYDTGNDAIFYYNDASNSLYVFKYSTVGGAGSIDYVGILSGTYSNKKYLVSKCIDSLTISFVGDDIKRDADGNEVLDASGKNEESEAYTTHTLPTGLTEYIPNTKLVRIVCSVTYDRRSKNSDVTYTIRN